MKQFVYLDWADKPRRALPTRLLNLMPLGVIVHLLMSRPESRGYSATLGLSSEVSRRNWCDALSVS